MLGQLALLALESGATAESFWLEALMGDYNPQSFKTAAAPDVLAVSAIKPTPFRAAKEECNKTRETFDPCFLGRETIVYHIWGIFSRRQKEKKRRNSCSFYCSSSQSC